MSNAPIPSRPVSIMPASRTINLSRLTHVVCNVYHWNHCSLRLGGDHISMVSLIDFHIHVERLTEGCDFQVVSIRAPSSHMLEVVFEHTVCFFRGRGSIINRCRERSSILPFRVSSHSTSRVDLDELLVEGCMLTHVSDHARAKLAMLGLITVHLIRECVKETVACD